MARHSVDSYGAANFCYGETRRSDAVILAWPPVGEGLIRRSLSFDTPELGLAVIGK